jgi:hypothetical protein
MITKDRVSFAHVFLHSYLIVRSFFTEFLKQRSHVLKIALLIRRSPSQEEKLCFVLAGLVRSFPANESRLLVLWSTTAWL